jgi:integrase
MEGGVFMTIYNLYLDARYKEAQLKVRLTTGGRGNRKTTLIPTGIYIDPKQWDDKRKRDRKNNAVNTRIFALCGEIDKYLDKCRDDGRKPDVQAVKRLISGEDDGTAFMPYFCKFRDTKSARTWEIYEATRKKLEAFGASSMTFEDFDVKTLKRFDDFLAKSSPSPNARAIHLRNIRAVFNAAIADEITECYPFRKFKISYEPTRKRSVSVDTLRHIIFDDCQFPRERDIFVLSFLLWGINMVDLSRLTTSSIVDGRLEYRRAKTGKLYSVKIEPEAQTIIDKYHEDGSDKLITFLGEYKDYRNYIFRIDERLKKMYGGDISTYWARHTFATLLAELDTPIDTISLALGHSYGSKVTQVYINPDLRKADEAVRKLIDYVYRK